MWSVRPCLPFSDYIQPLQDILENIKRIERFLDNKGPRDVAGDDRTLFACQYALLIISEAAKRLGSQAEVLCPGQPWRDIRGIGNHLRHAYDDLDAMLIWKVYQDDLPSLKIAVSDALHRILGPEPPMV
jgi:uncharacterized protein with HEPN domain